MITDEQKRAYLVLRRAVRENSIGLSACIDNLADALRDTLARVQELEHIIVWHDTRVLPESPDYQSCANCRDWQAEAETLLQKEE